MLNIGITTGSYLKKGSAEADYVKMASYGYTYGDYSGISNPESTFYTMSDEDMKKALEKEKETAKAAGITFSQVHGTWPVDDTSAEKVAANLIMQKTCVRATAYLGCKNLVVHPLMPYSWGEELDSEYAEKINEEFFRELCTYAQDYGVNICIENMPTKKHKLASIRNLVPFVKKLDMPNFLICLDTGHCLVSGDDCGEMVRLCGDLLAVLHVHDNDGRCDAHVVPYFGKINWQSFKEGLADIGFGGVMSLESSLNSHTTDAMKEKLRMISADIAKELADI